MLCFAFEAAMNRLSVTSFTRTLTAFALRLAPPDHHAYGVASATARGGGGFGAAVGAFVAPYTIASSLITSRTRRCRISCYASSATPSFQPSHPPPGTHGTPAFADIDFATAHSSLDKQKRNQDKDAVFVVTGANRGIGLQFVKALMDRTQGTIVACCRSPETAADLIALSSVSSNRLQIQTLDVEDEQSIADFGTYMRQSYARVDLLLNIAGVLGDAKTTPGPEKSVAGVDRDWLQKTLQVNVMGPVMLTKELHPLLIQSRRTGRSSTTGSRLPDESSPLERPKAVVVNLSARVGSISDNNLGGWYSYRMSKAALNMFTRTLALELKRQSVWAVALHPGTTNTDLSKPFQANVRDGSLFPVDFTVAQLFNVIDSLKEENSGGFYDWSGQSLSF